MTTPDTPGDGSHESAPTTPLPAYSANTTTLPPQPPIAPATKGLALAALIVGIGAFLFGLVPVFGAIVGLVAIVLGVLALRKRQSKGLALTGVILGGVALLTSVGMTIGLTAAVENASNDKSPLSQPETSQEVTPPEPTEVAETAAPEPAAPAAPSAPAAPEVPIEFKSALTKAASYSDNMYMSKAGIYDQLTSQYGEQFSPEAAQYGIDNVQADWNANALSKAKSYQESMSMSPAAIRDQLVSEYGEQFTAEEADFAIAHLND